MKYEGKSWWSRVVGRWNSAVGSAKNGMADESGQGMVEYLVLVVLVGIFAISVVSIFGSDIEETFNEISQQVQGLGDVASDADNSGDGGWF